MIFIKYLSLVIAIMYTFSNTFRAIRGQSVSAFQMLMMGIGIAAYIALEFELGY